MTTYFVSSISGSDSSAGTSTSDPLASLQAAEALVQPGDTVEVMNGTYTGDAPYGGDVLDITTSGTASAPITFEAAPGATPVIDNTGGWAGIKLMASYNVVEGFTVEGDAANITLVEAIANYGTGNPYYDGNGIAIVPGGSTTLPNHDTIENNTVYNEPGGGIYTEGSDYVQILNNVVYDNAHWSAYGNSGISIGTSVNLDTAAGPHIIVSGNTVYGNAQEVPTVGAGVITDGEGIILDTNTNYTGEILVSDNTVDNNGSTGIAAYLTNNAVITDNTLYGDNTENVQLAANSEIFLNQSTDDTVSGNVDPACYCRGTRIFTARGEIAVEHLAVGDCAETVSGRLRPIRWIGHRRVDISRHPEPLAVYPVRVSAGAFGEGLPRRDLWLSPGHSVLFEGVLIPISKLLNGVSVAQVERESVEYWHIELDEHDVLLADGLPAESYLDCGNRSGFANGGAFIDAHPDFRPKQWQETCLPIALQGPEILGARVRLDVRLESQGYKITEDAEAHVLVDNRRIEPTWLSESRLQFVLPENGRMIALRSAVFVPASMNCASADLRELGLCVQRLQVDGETIALDEDGACGIGWQQATSADGRFQHRWTNGAVALSPGARVIIVDLAGFGRYWRKPTSRAPALAA